LRKEIDGEILSIVYSLATTLPLQKYFRESSKIQSQHIKMKTTIALLVLLSIPCEILSFSAQSSTTAAIQRRTTTRSKFIFKAADDNKSDVGLLEPQQAVATDSSTETNGDKADEECILGEEEELTETQKLLKKVKQAGTAGAISYAAWELAFWGVSSCCQQSLLCKKELTQTHLFYPPSLLSFSL
jgi:hypothetical protein